MTHGHPAFVAIGRGGLYSTLRSLLSTCTRAFDTLVHRARSVGLVKMAASSKYIRKPLKCFGTLDSHEFFEITPCIGREYANLSIRDMLYAPNSDDMIRDFAVIVSTRGVVFLRTGNEDLTLQEQRHLLESSAFYWQAEGVWTPLSSIFCRKNRRGCTCRSAKR